MRKILVMLAAVFLSLVIAGPAMATPNPGPGSDSIWFQKRCKSQPTYTPTANGSVYYGTVKICQTFGWNYAAPTNHNRLKLEDVWIDVDGGCASQLYNNGWGSNPYYSAGNYTNNYSPSDWIWASAPYRGCHLYRDLEVYGPSAQKDMQVYAKVTAATLGNLVWQNSNDYFTFVWDFHVCDGACDTRVVPTDDWDGMTYDQNNPPPFTG